MRTGVAFFLLGLAQIHWAAVRGGGWLFVAWSGAAFAAVGLAYAARTPRLLGKRPDGRMHPAGIFFFFPYLLVTFSRWWLDALVSGERRWDEVRPGLFVGRWPGSGPLPDGVAMVVDLTAEMPELRPITRDREYVCLPTLDATPPESDRFAEVVHRVASSPAPVYVHCALGHGRSATVAAGVLLYTGAAATVADAVGLLAASRPRVRLGRGQRRLLDRFASRLPGPGAGSR